MKKHFSIFVHLLLLIVLISGGIAAHKNVAAQSSSANMSGWAWSDNIGWISFNCNDVSNLCTTSPYGVSVSATTGQLSGYAWSDQVGWLSFNAADVGGCPDEGSCTATVDFSTGKMTGFARFCSATTNGDCTGDTGDQGWDGWLKLSDVTTYNSPNTAGTGGATFDISTTKVVGYGWGGDAVGWVKFDNSYNQGVKINIDPSTFKCDINGSKYDLNTVVTRYKNGSATSTEACKPYSATCVQTSPVSVAWDKDITPIASGTYSYSACSIDPDAVCVDGNNPCDVSNLVKGTDFKGSTLSCGQSMKFYKNKVVVNNSAGTISCDSNSNSSVRRCENGTLTGDSSYDKPVCRVNPYQKER